MAATDLHEDSLISISKLSKANNFLAVQLYKILLEKEENLFFSPFSISAALAMLYCGTEKETAKQMHQTLGYVKASLNQDELMFSFQDLFTSINKKYDAYTLTCANSVLTDKEFFIKQDYKTLLNEYFKAIIEEVDFVNGSVQAVSKINNWVKEKTNNLILKVLDSLDPSTVMVLLNAVYFKGLWVHQFDKENTYQQSFYNKGIESNAKSIQMMHLKNKFPYIENETFKAIQLPYKGEDIAMIIVLPKTIDGLDEVEITLTESFFKNLNDKMIKRDVEVALPNFRLEYSSSLKKYFKTLGMEKVFLPGAHFGRISDSDNLYISEIIHKAVIEVNEEGSEAAAVTAAVMMTLLPLDISSSPEAMLPD